MTGSVAELALQHATHTTLVRRVKLLSWLSLAWMTAEGAIGVTAGILANSIALIGYGLDSTIEGIASIVIIGASPASASTPTTQKPAPRRSSPSASSCSRPTSSSRRSTG